MSHRWPAEPAYDDPYTRRRAPPMDPASNASYTHSRTRTTSSNTFPAGMQGSYQPNPYQPQMHLAQPPASHQRRSPSVNTFSTVSSGGMAPSAAYRTSPTLDVRRSTSSRSGGAAGSQPSYVALLRKQKATVWCERAQYEDPRLQAQQRAAKMRANREIVGAGSGLGLGLVNTGRTATGLSSTGGKVAAKIRHHGKPTVIGYSPGNNFNGVGGVPLRLSATEVEGEESEDDDAAAAAQRMHHRRTGSSGRNSTSSARRAMAYRSSGGLGPASGATRWSPAGTPDRTGSLVENKPSDQSPPADDSASGRAKSFASGSSGERLDNVPELNGASSHRANNSMRNAALTREKSVKTVDELKRRGSVDERTMTLTSGRLYIANPD
ncbi:hypothetical protein C7999DRAFT_37920 [Corynascus novoguineensis]|uniref:Uncharacterized protein n=1 Tax=Corynascus novoguineensis TaxID=1126955 RepID=A0AAN7HTQ2_9PEZI|nr:hypothetical protein C7999DRAFT_37920 [Corynascus novoguineensis]